MRPPRDQSLLSASEAAALLGVSRMTIVRMVEALELPAVKTPGGHRRVPRPAVDALIEGRDAA